MEKKTILSVNQYTKVLVPASSYKLEEDPRLLIPFTSGNKIGFVDKNGVIIVEPQYDMYYGDCYSKKKTKSESLLKMFMALSEVVVM